MGQNRQLRAIDGFAFGAYEAMPKDNPRGAIVVIQEIFGVNSHIRNVTDGYAAAGYAALAPQIFDRVERNVELGYEQQDMTRGIEIARGKLKMEQTLQDLQATVEDAKRFGKVGVVGYCFDFDPKGKTYVFNILRVSATVVLAAMGAFLFFLLFTGNKHRRGRSGKS